MKFLKKNIIYFIPIVLIVIIGIIYLVIKGLKEEPASIQSGENINFLQNYEVNQIAHVYITDEQMANIYLNDYIKKMHYDRESAYELLDEDFKKSTFPSFSDYDKYIDDLLEKTKEFNFRYSSMKKIDSKEFYYVLDSNGYRYTFEAIAVMMYTVQFSTNQ